MYQTNSLVNQNPLLNQFNGYNQTNPNVIPFQNNALLNRNVHVSNSFNEILQQHKNVKQNIPVYQSSSKGNKSTNIIQDLLKPQKVTKDNKDVMVNYKANEPTRTKEYVEKQFPMSNAPYKVILKDKIVTKNVKDVTLNDITVHKADRSVDANRKRFDAELDKKKDMMKTTNDELKVEFAVDNYDNHKKKFEYKETFIRNMGFQQNTFDQSKTDYIEFYQKKQKEAEEGKKLCDQILKDLVNNDIISKDEILNDD